MYVFTVRDTTDQLNKINDKIIPDKRKLIERKRK
jgi:hypothetical protein